MINYWLCQADSIRGFLKRLGLSLLVIVLFLIYFIGISALIETYIKSVNNDCLFISTKVLDNIICIIIPVIIVIMILAKIITMIKIRQSFHKGYNKIFSITYYCIILSLILVFINSLNNYTVFYKDKIVKNNAIKYFEKEYSYSDIESADIGIKWRNRKYPSFYYKIKFKDEFKLNITNGIIFGNYDINDLVEINEILIGNKIVRNIDRVYLDIFTIDSQENYKSKIKRVFSE